ncbi:MAG: hypothetical protein K2R98_11285 [Gemmataceae bacterium]|nr:hypothetical protein [Gemmataceae bacterium]
MRPIPIPEDFVWTDVENQKFTAVARMVNCSVPTARELVVYLLRYVQENTGSLAVAHLPDVLSPFPVKWGYKKKRNDFLRLMHDLDFIYTRVNYWAKIRAKKYAPSKSGQELLDRLSRHATPDRTTDSRAEEIPSMGQSFPQPLTRGGR